ncbi:hypothetical protein T4D_10130 [Trichinella pseudospiralis]|uniref:Uncharacterized protein n=1 Tax=Trichinella pseudospiralis TaxID=6337 RepID=A0A0V1FWU0_TRIPS|nr:hypothetical protein T4D_10130 [Trichinella pseudospiralis]
MSPIVADLIMNVMTFEKISVVFFIFSMAFVLMLLENQYPSAKLTHWIVHKTKVRTLCLGISIRCSILSHRWITSEETCLSKQNVAYALSNVMFKVILTEMNHFPVFCCFNGEPSLDIQ